MITSKPLVLTSKILLNLVNTLAADEMYSFLNRDNLTIPIQMQLSQKQKKFSQIPATFLKSKLNLEYFRKKDDAHSFCISEITESENVIK